MANIAEPPLVLGLKALAPFYRALICDVWGVVHDGVHAFPAAVDALIRWRQGGGEVVFLTNAPRPKGEVVAQLDRLGVARAAYGDVITSGEVARSLLAARPGAKVFHVGPDRDLPLYEGLPIVLVADAECQLVSCTGLVDDTRETPDDYAGAVRGWRARKLPMLCSNPDIVVQRGSQLVWCAGAIAERYRQAGGEAIIVGKPHPEVYATAIARLAGLGPPLAIGDGIETDVRGAVSGGIDVVFVTHGIHRAEIGGQQGDAADVAGARAFLAKAGLGARAITARLTWDH